MAQAQMMPIEEKLDILVKSIELDNAGRHEEAERLHKTAPHSGNAQRRFSYCLQRTPHSSQ